LRTWSIAARLWASLALALSVASAFGAGEENDTSWPTLRPALRPAASGAPTQTVAGSAGNPAGENTIYGSPPGSGAGTTGFVSTNVPVRRAKNKKPIPARTAATMAAANSNPERKQNTGSVGRPPRHTEDDNPYDPAGVRVGSFVVKPRVEISAGYDDNPFRTASAPGSRFTMIEGLLTSRSDWSRHELAAELRGAFTKYWNVEGNDRPLAEAKLRGRIDVSSTSKIELEGKAALTTEPAGSPDAITAVKRPPNVYTFGGTAGFVQRFNRLELGLRGSVERSTYEDAELISGGVVDQSDRNFTSYGTKLRAGYEVTPGMKPFVEAGVDRRVFDRDIDFDGVRRGSDGFLARAGVEFEPDGYLSGEASVGYARRTYRDPNLSDVSGLLVDSSLVWKASALTKVTLKANSEIGETMLLGASGVLKREATVVIDHAFRRWLVGSAGAGYATYDYRGIDRKDERLALSAALTYYLNSSLALRGELRRERLQSNVPGQDYTANIALIGLRLQR
jgi:hypothetical protein